jgi:hypothetical protein
VDDPKEIDVHQRSPFVPQAIKDATAGVRRSVAPLLNLVDTTDPAFSFIAAELQSMADADVELNPVSIDIATKVGRQKHREEQRKRHSTRPRLEIVYYVRRSDLIKIGTTVNPAKRFDSLMPDEILAFEPGGPDLELQRHRQFHPERITRKGEYFRQSPRLLKHVAGLRQLHGPPHPTWPSVATLGEGYSRSKVKVVLPELKTKEVATAAEAAKLLDIHVSTVSQWVRRGRITAAGSNEKGRPVYYVEHLRFLIQRSREYMNQRREG